MLGELVIQEVPKVSGMHVRVRGTGEPLQMIQMIKGAMRADKKFASILMAVVASYCKDEGITVQDFLLRSGIIDTTTWKS